jgi:biopolymer transport protein ExbB/TolQ
VPQQRERNSLFNTLSHLGWPLLTGAAASSVFYALILRGPLNMPSMHRYFATHPVSFAATIMFFVGVAALLIKLLDVAGQYASLGSFKFDVLSRGEAKVDQADDLLGQLSQLGRSARASYMGQRLNDAFEHVQRKGSADGLDEELKYLADLDAGRQQESYSLVRIITWATPMLGFLGTVIGITQALGDLDPQQLATDIQGAMEGLLAGLYVAFDTTALALSLSIVLMFLQFLIDRIETELLATVDTRCNQLLVGRFEQIGGTNDPFLSSVQQMSTQVLHATEEVVQRQAELWQGTIDSAHHKWSELVQASGQQTQDALSQSLDRSLQKLTVELGQVERQSADRARQRWEQLQTALSDNARAMQAQQKEMIRHGDLLMKVVQATGDVVALEKTLNDNLQALAGAKNFEDTVMSLSAAIHLLNTRLGAAPGAGPHVDLQSPSAEGRAA